MTFATPISAQDFQKGWEAAQSGDFETALQELTPLAEGGNYIAQYYLGAMYHNGWGVPQDRKEAVWWWKLVAEQGHAMAQNNLGAMYVIGQGVLTDFVLAHMWVNLASANGLEIGPEHREKIAELITPEEILKAQTMATVCMNSNYKKCRYLPNLRQNQLNISPN